MAWTLEIHHIDVGQGESTLIIAQDPLLPPGPNRQRSVLIDGGRADTASYVHEYVAAHLNGNLDRIITTHYDIDHSGGITTLLLADNRSMQTRMLADIAAAKAVHWALLGQSARVSAGVAAAAVAATALGGYGVYAAATDAAAMLAAIGPYGAGSVRSAAEFGYTVGMDSALDEPLMNPSILPTQPMTKIKRVSIAAGVAAGNAAAAAPGGGEAGPAAAAVAAINTVLRTLTTHTSRFDTGGIYSTANIIDRGDAIVAGPEAYRRALSGRITATNGHVMQIPGMNRMRNTPAIGREILWNSGANAMPAPDGAPRIWLVAANRYVRNAPQHDVPVNGDSTNSVGLGFIVQFNGFFYYTGGDLEIPSEDLIGDDAVANPFPNPAGGNFNVPNHLCAFKCGHHGAGTSTSPHFLGTIRPNGAFISTGGTRFEHPDQFVINNLHSDPHIQNFYLTNCNFETLHIPASQGLDQLTAIGNRSRVAGDNRTNPLHLHRGNIVLFVHADESTSINHPPAPLAPNASYHGFRVAYWDEDRPVLAGGPGILNVTHAH
jgi:hypothetical protein